MLLRRFIQHMKDQNWVAVGLRVAVGEELGRDVGAEPDCTAAEVGDE